MEDIEVKCLKASSEQIKNNYTFGKGAMKDLARYIDATLDRLEQLEEENKEIKETYMEIYHSNIWLLEEIKSHHVPKYKIEQKIKELETNLSSVKQMNESMARFTTIQKLDYQIQILEELLKEDTQC